jgi:hypothetical protein
MVASSPSKERVSEPEEACIGQYRGKKSLDKSLRNIMRTRETLRQDMVSTWFCPVSSSGCVGVQVGWVCPQDGLGNATYSSLGNSNCVPSPWPSRVHAPPASAATRIPPSAQS